MLLLHGERYIFDTFIALEDGSQEQAADSFSCRWTRHSTAQQSTGMLAVDCRPAAEAIEAELHYGSTSVSQTFA
jgi:hypothetical protein